MMEFGKVLKTITTKSGKTAIFRYVKKEDIDDMLAYINALIDEDTFIERSGKHMTRNQEEEFMNKLLVEMPLDQFVHVVVYVDGRFVGSGDVRRGKLRHAHTAELGISILREFRSEGIGTELLKTLIDEGKRMGLRLLTLNCFENNDLAIHVYEKLGFKKAGVYPGAILFKDEYIGEVHMYLPLVGQ